MPAAVNQRAYQKYINQKLNDRINDKFDLEGDIRNRMKWGQAAQEDLERRRSIKPKRFLGLFGSGHDSHGETFLYQH